jgi:peptide deformylase
MALLGILIYPDPRLREVARPVDAVDDSIRSIVNDMAETMYAAPGVGLAATQVGIPLRIFIVDIATEDEQSSLRIFINPEIVERRGKHLWREGCLSFPDVAEEVKRAEWVRARALDINGQAFEVEADDLLAVAIQHETDHLDGILMIDQVSPFARRRIGRKLATRSRSAPAGGQ